MKPSEKILWGRDEIMAYIGRDTRHFKTFRDLGMPLGRINGRWIAYTDNLDDFIREFTRVSSSGITDDKDSEGD